MVKESCTILRRGEAGHAISGPVLTCFGQGFGLFAHSCGALDLVPVEGLAVDGADEGLEEDDGEDLPVGEALQPDVKEEPAVALVGGVAALQREGGRGG